MSHGLPHAFDVKCLRADNPGPLTLSGTNSWIVGREPAWVIDPGPALNAHLDVVACELTARGGAGGVLLTHDHADHAAGVAGLLERLPAGVPVGVAAAAGGHAIARGIRVVALRDGDACGPVTAMALPGHTREHLGFVWSGNGVSACFTGDAVLGEGSVFVAGDMRGYLDALRRLKALAPDVICPGHGPVVTAVADHLDRYINHRLERERDVLAALARGLRSESELLEAVWGPLADSLQAAATHTLRAHLEKLAAERRLPT